MTKIIQLVLSIASLVAWIYALLERFGSKDWIMLVLDVVIPPVGIIDGIGMYFGGW